MAETVLNQPEIKTGVPQGNKKNNARFMKILGIVLSLLMIALTVFVLNLQYQNAKAFERSSGLAEAATTAQSANYRAYVQQYKETKVQLDETTAKLEEVNHQLDLVSTELAATKGMLSQTNTMLASAQDENVKLKQEIQSLVSLQNAEHVENVGELEAKIKNLRQENVLVSDQLAQMKTQLRAFEADFATMDEGKSLITLFQNKITLVKSRMGRLRQEAYFARIAAQKEKDRLEALNGNNGFILRDGRLVKPGGNKSFAIDVKIVQ